VYISVYLHIPAPCLSTVSRQLRL